VFIIIMFHHCSASSVGDDSFVVTLDRRMDDYDGAIAQSVDVDSVEDVGATRRSVTMDSRAQRASLPCRRVLHALVSLQVSWSVGSSCH